MRKHIVPYQVCLILKSMGYDIPTLYGYDTLGSLYFANDSVFNFTNYNALTTGFNVSAPLYDEVFEWFRKKYKLSCFIPSTPNEIKWYYFIEDLSDRRNDSEPELTPKLDTFEEAREMGLRVIIERVKKN